MSHQDDIKSDQDNIKRLITRYSRRLQILREKKAYYGLETPVSILTEIEDIESEIEELQTEFAHLTELSLENDLPPIEPAFREIRQVPTNRIATELARYLKEKADENRRRYPIELNIDEIVDELQRTTDIEYKEIYGYIKGFFDLLKVIGCSDYEGTEKVVLDYAVNAATVKAFCMAIHENVFGIFNFYKSGYITNSAFGSWLLNKLERKREFFDPNREREPSRIRDYVVILVKAMLESEPAILFQYDAQRIEGKYKFIGGHVNPKDKGNLLVAAYREIKEEIQVGGESASNIQPRKLSKGPYEYTNISERVGAYTQYRVWVFDCSLTLPQGCRKQEFIGEQDRKTRWLPLSEVTPKNEDIAQKQVLRWIVTNDWLDEAQLSTSQPISRMST